MTLSTIIAAQAGPFRIRDMQYGAAEAQRRHAHEELQISIILRGGMVEEVRGVGYRGSAGDVVVKPAGTEHSNRFTSTRIVCLDAAPELLEMQPRAYGWHHRQATTPAAIRVVRALLEAEGLEDAVFELLGTLEDRPIRDGVLALRMARLLEETCGRPVSLAALADDFGVHPVYLARIFRARWQCSPREYLIRCRVRAVAAALASSSASLAEIALQCGFSDQPHMTRLFTRVTGVTPASFRRLVRS